MLSGAMRFAYCAYDLRIAACEQGRHAATGLAAAFFAAFVDLMGVLSAIGNAIAPRDRG
jgi:hypothetical protein